MSERDWDRDFDLEAWRALSVEERQAWIEQAWRRENDRIDVAEVAERAKAISWRDRYQRGQTAWDIGLEPQPFDIALATAVGVVKDELVGGVLFGWEERRDRVLSALLANAGVRRTVRLAPLEFWRQALHGEPLRPVVRPEFVARPDALYTGWLRHWLAQPFHRAEFDQAPPGGDRRGMRTLQIGYLQLGQQTLARPDLIVLREEWRGAAWPKPADAQLVVEISANRGDLLYDWQVRRPAYLEAGADEVWGLDAARRRILRQRRGQEPIEVRYRPDEPEQAITFVLDEASLQPRVVSVRLDELFDHVSASTAPGDQAEAEEIERWAQREQARLELFEVPWTIGFTPQPFHANIGDLMGRFKDELWQGCLFGPEHRRDEILSAVLANVGLLIVVSFAPRELWEHALDQLEQHRPGEP